ncbi:hypothetical protein E4U41_005304 [Claviceps citrina]|nr:hypothetical protein E4U41_005304 [Claviceps citrina]
MSSITALLQTESIYIAMYSTAHLRKFHWGLVLIDSMKQARLFHANNRVHWLLEEKPVSPEQSLTLVVLIRLDKVRSLSRTKKIMRSIPADGSPSRRTGEFFTCRIWVKDAIVALHDQGEIALPTDIDSLETLAVGWGLKYASRAEGGGGATLVDDVMATQ